MFISEEQFLQAISNMMDKKLDARLCEMPTKTELDARLSEMPTKAELDARLSEMPTKAELDARLCEMPTKAELDARLSKMPTKKEMADSLYRLENNLLEELDIVQEKANRRFERLENRMVSLESAVNAIRIESSTINLLAEKYSDLETRVEGLEQKIS